MPITRDIISHGRNIETTIVTCCSGSSPFRYHSASTLKKLLLSVRSNPAPRIVGLDIEQSESEIEALKLSTRDTCLFIQLYDSLSIPDELHRFFQLSEISFVGLGMKYIAEALERVFKIRIRNAVDLGSLAASVMGDERLKSFGSVDLAKVVCGFDASVRIPKLALSHWCYTCPTDELVESATYDVQLAFLIGDALLSSRFG